MIFRMKAAAELIPVWKLETIDSMYNAELPNLVDCEPVPDGSIITRKI